MNTTSFIEKAQKIHNGKYNYSKVVLIDLNTEVCIICPEHGEFWQKPKNHLKGYGCKKCQYERLSAINSMCKDEFVKKAIKLYGDKFSYDKTIYKNNHTKVIITCPKHGDFEITPNDFLDGHSCKKCANEKRAENLSLTKDEFIEKAKSIHGDKYDYSKINYKNTETRVCIICPKHGEFWQTPHSHLNGRGCKECKKEKLSEINRTPKNIFIDKASKLHDGKYDYSLIEEYLGGRQIIPIICPKHGVFYQRAEDHLNGHGCKKCYNSKMENEISSLLENNGILYEQRVRNLSGITELDFYLPEYNTGIECQGEQHFKPVDFGGKKDGSAELNFQKQTKRDREKKIACDKNGIKLIYFSNVNVIYPYKVITNKDELLKEIKNGKE